MHRADTDDLAGSARDGRDDAAAHEFENGFASAQELARQVDGDDGVPLLQAHRMERCVSLQPGIVDEDIDGAEFGDCAPEHFLHLPFFGDVRLAGESPDIRTTYLR